MSECVSAQLLFIIEKKVTSPSPWKKNGHSQTGSNIFVTGHMRWSGAITCQTCQLIIWTCVIVCLVFYLERFYNL